MVTDATGTSINLFNPDIQINLVHVEVELLLESLNYYRKNVTEKKYLRWCSEEMKVINSILDKMNISKTKLVDMKLANFEKQKEGGLL